MWFIIVFSIPVAFLIFVIWAIASNSTTNTIKKSLEEHIKSKGIEPESNFTISQDRVYLTWDSRKHCILFLQKGDADSEIEEQIFENYDCCKMIHFEDTLHKSTIYVDDKNKKVLFVEYYTGFSSIDELKIKEIEIEDILELSIEADFKNSSKRSTLSTIGRATVGGVVAGGVGSLVGASTASVDTTALCVSLSLQFKLNSVQEPNFSIRTFSDYKGMPGIKHTEVYKKTLELQDTISVILNQMNVDESKSKKNISGSLENNEADELFRLVELRKKKFITEEEFEILKKKIINN